MKIDSEVCDPPVIENPTSIDDIPRYEEPNPFNYTPLQKSIRNNEIDKFVEKYPHLPTRWIEWCFDIVNNRPIEETRKIIESGELEKPPEVAWHKGGIIENSVSIENPKGNSAPDMTSYVVGEDLENNTTTHRVEVDCSKMED
jgi:hypothetical protein